jgi:protein-disulfide isomerase
MKLDLRIFKAAALAAALAMPVATSAPAQEFTTEQRSELHKIIREYLLAHPEVLQEAMRELEAAEASVGAEKARAFISENADTMFNSSRQVNFGNPNGDVTLVEFFDYNCGFCKRAMSDMLDLLKTDPKLKFVLKEFPVLGEGSVQAAQVAVAVRIQDGSNGKKYLDFHQKLLGARGQVDRTVALAAAREAGLDMVRLEKDMLSDEVKASLEETFKLAEALGLNGTPSYVLGTSLVIGAVGLPALQEKINVARCGKAIC